MTHTHSHIRPSTVLIDTRTGLPTREMFRWLEWLDATLGDATSEALRVDATQTLTNKTIDGDANTLRDIATSSLKSVTGEDTAVVTGTAGTSGNLLAWNADGDAVDAEVSALDFATPADLELYTPLDGIARVAVYTVATLPVNATAGQIILVSDEVGGATLAFADGTNWRRVQDRAVVS